MSVNPALEFIKVATGFDTYVLLSMPSGNNIPKGDIQMKRSARRE